MLSSCCRRCCSPDGKHAVAGCKLSATESRSVSWPGVVAERVLCAERSHQGRAWQQWPLTGDISAVTDANAARSQLPSADVAADVPQLSRQWRPDAFSGYTDCLCVVSLWVIIVESYANIFSSEGQWFFICLLLTVSGVAGIQRLGQAKLLNGLEDIIFLVGTKAPERSQQFLFIYQSILPKWAKFCRLQQSKAACKSTFLTLPTNRADIGFIRQAHATQAHATAPSTLQWLYHCYQCSSHQWNVTGTPSVAGAEMMGSRLHTPRPCYWISSRRIYVHICHQSQTYKDIYSVHTILCHCTIVAWIQVLSDSASVGAPSPPPIFFTFFCLLVMHFDEFWALVSMLV